MTNHAEPLPGAKPSSPLRGAFDRMNWQESLGLLTIYALLVVVLSLRSPYFASVNNFLNILVAVSTIGIIAVAMTMVIVSGGLDLSVGSVVALAGVAVAQLSHHMAIWPAVLIGLLIGLVVGFINGVMITRAGINPLIATLGTLSVARGLSFVFSGGLTQSIDDESFAFLGRGFVLGVPFQVWVMAALFLLAHWVMNSTVFGRSIYAVGGNSQASRLAGLPVTRLQLMVYVLSGLSAALGGVFLASQLGAGAPAAAAGIELSVIAAVILGGTSLSGGKGTIAGTLLGVLILGTLNNGLTLLNVSSYYQEVARGIVLLLAVGLDQLRLRLANRD
ncbi:MAG TPA: ABC transporter permease [Abditibacteriaceae bacterium]|jgi:ribose transport system permease protein